MEVNSLPQLQQHSVKSKDGAVISYYTKGEGPGLIIIPGALSLAANYFRLAADLSKSFTVHIIERRGRGLSGSQGENYSVAKECEDLAAIQSEINAKYLFGHSY